MSNSGLPTLFIQADNVHQGGGKSLLNALINSTIAEQSFFLLDSRMPLDCISDRKNLIFFKPTVLGRLMAQFWLWKNLLPTSTLLCFGNLPPLFNVKGTVIVFIQNRYIIDDIKLKKLSFKIRLRLFFERIWFNGRCHKVNEFIVQTSSMKILLKKRLLELRPELANMVPIKVSPFIENISINGYTYTSSSNDHSKRFDYIYPASGEAHKNHKKLIDAFIILAEQGHFPSLVLTLDEKKFPEILQEVILEKEKFNLNIVNMGFLPHSELLRLYSSIRYLIYPSFFESFGIPLVEAQQAGLPIIAAELDYVRDSVNPDQSFDPNSSVSIARAIKRSLGLSDELATVLDADKFLLKISPPL